MIFSDKQERIFEEVENTNNNIVIEATAGSGKTTTIVFASSLIPKHKKTLFTAFNNHTVDEIKTRIGKNIDCTTTHSIGYKAIKNHFQCNIKLSEWKISNMFDRFVNEKKIKLSRKEKNKLSFFAKKSIDLMRLNLCTTKEQSIEVLDFYGILLSIKEMDLVYDLYLKVIAYNKKKEKEKIIDYVDMLFIPAWDKSVKLEQYDVVFIDEVQDLNLCQHTILTKSIKESGRFIAVGDPNQSIYLFAGVTNDSFHKLLEFPRTVQLPLTISYRCPKKVVEHAKILYDDIEAYEKNIEGIVRTSSDFKELKSGDMVLCRNVAPLVKAYFELLMLEKKSQIIGKETEAHIEKYLDKIEYMSKEQALDKMVEFEEQLIDELVSRGVQNPKKHKKFNIFNETRQIIEILLSKCELPIECKDYLHDIFSQKDECIDLMTIHKSKGLERDNVYLLNSHLIPSRFAESEEELIQEKNLLFVAITRAKKSFNYLEI